MKVVESKNEIDSGEESDNDICDESELSKIFNLKCEPLTSKIINKNNYILHLDATRYSEPNLIAGLSDNTAEIYRLSNDRLAQLLRFEAPANVIGVKSCLENEYLFYVGTTNCEITLVDIRDRNVNKTFKDTTNNTTNYRPLNCFDVSANNLLLCGGTDLYGSDAYLIFWDIRNVKLLGAYWDSHTDDITQVAFHSNNPNKLISGSTDGLINIYDLSQTCEDKALIDSLNTESSIEKLHWYFDGNSEMISCVTHTSDLQLWRLEDAEPYSHFHKEKIAKELRRKLEGYCYIATTQINKNNKLLALVGSNYGDGECLRAFGVHDKNLQPLFNVKENTQRIRCSWLNNTGDILVTGGEKGVLDVWNVETNFECSGGKKR